jgi:hypothetical protein
MSSVVDYPRFEPLNANTGEYSKMQRSCLVFETASFLSVLGAGLEPAQPIRAKGF